MQVRVLPGSLLREGKLDAENVVSLRESPVRQRTLRAPFGARSTRRKLSLSGKRPYALRERPVRPARLARPLRHTQARPAAFLQGLPARAPFSARPLAARSAAGSNAVLSAGAGRAAPTLPRAGILPQGSAFRPKPAGSLGNIESIGGGGAPRVPTTWAGRRAQPGSLDEIRGRAFLARTEQATVDFWGWGGGSPSGLSNKSRRGRTCGLAQPAI